MRRLGSLLVLLALIGGPPPLLTGLGFYDWGRLNVFAPADYRILLALLTVAAWGAWLVFVLAVVSEAVRLVTGGRLAFRLPGLAAPQAVAGALLAGLLAAGVPAGVAAAAPPRPVPATAPLAASGPVSGSASEADAAASPVVARDGVAGDATAPGVAATDAALVHVVGLRDDLWSLAEQYHGSGAEWRRIVRANPDLLGADPTTDLPVGTALAIVNPLEQYHVERGDTLWQLAGERLGDPARYPELQRLNADQIADPDYIEAGWTLRLPAGEGAPASTPAASTPAASTPAASTPAASTPAAPPEATAAAAATTEAAVPQAAASTAPAAVNDPEPEPDADPLDSLALRGVLGGLAALAASGVLGGLLARRRERASGRDLGRTFADPQPELQRLETALGLSGLTPVAPAAASPAASPADPQSAAAPAVAPPAAATPQPHDPADTEAAAAPTRERLVGRAQRLLAAHWWTTGQTAPPLRRALIAEDAFHVEFAEAAPTDLPPAFEAGGAPGAVRAPWSALAASGEPDHPVAYPALVTLGRDGAGNLVLIDLVGWGLLSLEGDDLIPAMSLSAMLVELACSAWASEVTLWAVTADRAFVDVAASEQVRCFVDVAGALGELERHAAERAALLALSGADPGRLRLDPDTADAWAPIILLLERAPDADQLERLHAAVAGGAGLAVVVAADAPLSAASPSSAATQSAPEASGRLRLTQPGPDAEPRGVLEPGGITVAAQTLDPAARAAIAALYAEADADESVPAAWWHEEPDEDTDEDPDDEPAEPQRLLPDEPVDELVDEHAPVERVTLRALRVLRVPRLRLFGRVRLEGATGEPPSKAQRRCLEYCAWLLEHPGATASDMTRALFVTDGTRRSNVSRLRAWLGVAPGGELYLPEAYTGRIELHPAVTSDWLELQRLLGRGVNHLTPDRLWAALALVDGAPLADGAPGEWAWADGLRARMCAAVRDLVVVLARVERERGHLDAARDACERGQRVVGDDELIACERLQVEAAAGDLAGARAVLAALQQAARDAGTDLRPETVALGQEILEGRARFLAEAAG